LRSKPTGRASGEQREKPEERDDRDDINGWLLQTPPGLAQWITKELNFVGATERRPNVFVKKQRNHDLIFLNKAKAPENLAKLRIAEAVFRCPVYGRYKVSKRQTDRLAREMKALGPRRLVVSATGRHFERHDLGRWLAKELESKHGYAFTDGVEDEVWMFSIDEEYYFGIPIVKSRAVAGRDERQAERKGALPPPIAAALAFSLNPSNDDVVLDPVCGSGTLLAEFGAYAPEARLIGVDIDPEATTIAKRNLKHLSRVEVTKADSRKHPPTSDGVKTTALLANLPFGVQFGKRPDNPALYRDILINALESADRAKWRGIVFTSDTGSLSKAIAGLGLRSEEVLRVKVRGEAAYGFKLTLG
jgi:predicted RNA methylase